MKLLSENPLNPNNAHKLFGVIPLFQIASIYGVPYEILANERERLHAPPAEGRAYTVNSATISALGVIPDAVVAFEFNIPQALACKLREHLGIPPTAMSRIEAKRALSDAQTRKYWSKKEPLLGTDTDTRIAKLLDLPVKWIRNRRRVLGIPEFSLPIKPILPPYSWSDSEIRMLGTIPDCDLADALGLPRLTVRRHRQSLGIPNFKKITKPQVCPLWHSLVGSMPDAELAQQTGYSRTRIVQLRHKYRIPDYRTVQRLSDPRDLVLALINVPSSGNLAEKLLANSTRLIELMTDQRF
ncbi:hypothetical protein H8F21_15900 [Pseudomonas sp. P66]|uniref:DNA-binding protein n=1 Tax=Pseudomonas arcuscaelestis TaxID=2710591 RepID=A0ABS2BZK8_9PSED|nr:hypothetical protein [Pseudomonas arcuscaelestis]MBM5459052.1 hypothetical protein [Pseudomonas arcuscaelestis]